MRVLEMRFKKQKSMEGQDEMNKEKEYQEEYVIIDKDDEEMKGKGIKLKIGRGKDI